MHYLDTSLLVSALAREPDSVRVRAWLDEHAAEELAISEWVATEFSAALSIKLRTGQIDYARRAAAVAAFTNVIFRSCTMLPVTTQDFRAAGIYASHHKLALRAGDALHLAVCAENGATLCTLDRRLAAAGTALGVKNILL
jgi:predicted nucleic acid-binding protein